MARDPYGNVVQPEPQRIGSIQRKDNLPGSADIEEGRQQFSRILEKASGQDRPRIGPPARGGAQMAVKMQQARFHFFICNSRCRASCRSSCASYQTRWMHRYFFENPSISRLRC